MKFSRCAKLRVEYISKHVWPSISAAAVVTNELAKGLAARGHNVTVLVPASAFDYMKARSGAPPVLPSGSAICCWGPRLSRFPANTLSYLILLFKSIPLGFRSHVILGHYHHSNLSGACAAITSMISRRPLVIRADDILTESRGVIAKGLALMFRLITMWSFRRAKLVLVTGDELVEPVRERFGLNEVKVMVSYNGVDTEKFNPRNRSEQLRRTIGSEHIIVFSGELFAPRGVDVLLQALASLKKDIPDIRAVIMGDGPDLNRLITLANSLHLDGSVKFLGAVNPLFVPQYLASADVAIGPLKAFLHTYGTTPLKVLEYMASGCTVVAGIGAASGNLIIDGVNCLCIRSGDAVDLARQVLRLFSDKELARRVRERARQTVETTYDWRIVASDLEKRLMDVASRR